MDNIDMVRLNDEALTILEQGDFSRSLVILKKNAKKNPDHLTWNNLGLFYYENGNEVNGERWIAAKKLGIYYLSKAAKSTYNGINTINLANCLYQSNDFLTALHLYEGITEPQYQAISRYNKGVCLLALGDYQLAEAEFSDLTSPKYSEAFKALGVVSPSIPLAFSIATQIWKGEKRLSSSPKIDIQQLKLDLYDEIWLSFLLGEHSKVLKLFDSFLLSWQPNHIISAMLLECIEKDGGKQVLERKKALFDAFPKARKLLSLEQRDKLLHNNTYIPPLIEICGYYGCKLHHTPLPF